MLATAYNLALVTHQILLGETTGRVTRRTMPDLRLGTRRHLGTTHHVVATVLACATTTKKRREKRGTHYI